MQPLVRPLVVAGEADTHDGDRQSTVTARSHRSGPLAHQTTSCLFTTFNNGDPGLGSGEGSVQMQPVTTAGERLHTRVRHSFPLRVFGTQRLHHRRSLTAVLSVSVAGLPLALAVATPTPASAAPAPITIAYVTSLTGPGAAEDASAASGNVCALYQLTQCFVVSVAVAPGDVAADHRVLLLV